MPNPQIEPQQPGSVEDALALLPGGGREMLHSLSAKQVWAILAGEQEERAAIEAEDFWGQADEACAVDPIG